MRVVHVGLLLHAAYNM